MKSPDRLRLICTQDIPLLKGTINAIKRHLKYKPDDTEYRQFYKSENKKLFYLKKELNEIIEYFETNKEQKLQLLIETLIRNRFREIFNENNRLYSLSAINFFDYYIEDDNDSSHEHKKTAYVNLEICSIKNSAVIISFDLRILIYQYHLDSVNRNNLKDYINSGYFWEDERHCYIQFDACEDYYLNADREHVFEYMLDSIFATNYN
jgi:hypothetical protein